MMANLAYRAMVQEARRKGLPKSYKKDLIKTDKVALQQEHAPERFVWILREHGTWLPTDWYNVFDRSVLLYDHGREQVHYYVWDGRLREVSQVGCINILRRWRCSVARPYKTIQEARQEFNLFFYDSHSVEEIDLREKQYAADRQGSLAFSRLWR
jgi:hypothetical protein